MNTFSSENGDSRAGDRSVSSPPPARNRNLRPPWRKGQSGNPLGFRANYGEVVTLARQFSERAIRRLAELMESDDERVAAVAAQALLDRGWGKPRQAPEPVKDDDLSQFSDEELRARLRTLYERMKLEYEGEANGAPPVGNLARAASGR